jgi:leader peptidase (prepilin peptidase)/N-methyltransferase
MITVTYWVFAIIIFLAIGSFLNVVIYRYPKVLMQQWHDEAEEFLNPEAAESNTESHKTFNLAFPNSHCTHCEHPLSWWHNIPLLSFLFLGGRCAFCKKSISWQYPFIELITVLLAAAMLYRYGFSPLTIILILATFLLIVMSAIDFKEQLLPDVLTYTFLWLGLLQNTLFHIIPLSSAIYGAIFGYAILWLIGTGYRLVRKQEGMGYGDYKLLAAVGAWFGPYLVIITLLGASVVSLIVSFILLATNKMDRQSPLSFGPYLAIVAYLILLIGPNSMLAMIF